MRDIAVGSTGYGSGLRMIVGLPTRMGEFASMFAGLFAGGGSIAWFGLASCSCFGVSVLGAPSRCPLSRFLGSPFARTRGIAGDSLVRMPCANPKRLRPPRPPHDRRCARAFITIPLVDARVHHASIDKGLHGGLCDRFGDLRHRWLRPALRAAIGELPEVRAVTLCESGRRDRRQHAGVGDSTHYSVRIVASSRSKARRPPSVK